MGAGEGQLQETATGNSETTADTTVSEDGEEGGVSGARAGILLQFAVKPMVRQAALLPADHGG